MAGVDYRRRDFLGGAAAALIPQRSPAQTRTAGLTDEFHPGNTYTTRMVEHRGYTTREFDLTDFRARVEKQLFEREYSAEEIWSNYTYFMKAALPVAEQAGVKMALHPDDPPIAKMNGV